MQRRDGNEAWGVGHVTQLEPLKVNMSDTDPSEAGYKWDEVRPYDPAPEPATAQEHEAAEKAAAEKAAAEKRVSDARAGLNKAQRADEAAQAKCCASGAKAATRVALADAQVEFKAAQAALAALKPEEEGVPPQPRPTS